MKRIEELVLHSYAKVNLTLDVLSKRSDGYHEIRSVMLPVSLADTIALRSADNLHVTCAPPLLGTPESNLAWRAARLLAETTGYQKGATIQIEKRIPVAGGLGGGSSNAAAVLVGLNQLWGTGLSPADLKALGARLGADVPFFITLRPSRAEGIGERLTPVAVRQALWLVLATVEIAKSTGQVYSLFDQLPAVDHPDTVAMERALAVGDLERIAAAMGNVLEEVMLPRHPEIAALKGAMFRAGAIGALMSGAGPTVFGLAASREEAYRLWERIHALTPHAWLVHTIGPAESAP